ncbi:MAG: helix-turn-helix domain-containing protein, partial [Solirubrobacteraceae bacterium]
SDARNRHPSALTYHCFAYLAQCNRKPVDLLKASDVAQRLAVSRAWVYEAARSGRIPSVRIGGEDGPLRFVPEDIDQWLAEARAEWSPALRRFGRAAAAKTGERRPRTNTARRPKSKSPAVDQQSLL